MDFNHKTNHKKLKEEKTNKKLNHLIDLNNDLIKAKEEFKEKIFAEESIIPNINHYYERDKINKNIKKENSLFSKKITENNFNELSEKCLEIKHIANDSWEDDTKQECINDVFYDKIDPYLQENEEDDLENQIKFVKKSYKDNISQEESMNDNQKNNYLYSNEAFLSKLNEKELADNDIFNYNTDLNKVTSLNNNQIKFVKNNKNLSKDIDKGSFTYSESSISNESNESKKFEENNLKITQQNKKEFEKSSKYRPNQIFDLNQADTKNLKLAENKQIKENFIHLKNEKKKNLANFSTNKTEINNEILNSSSPENFTTEKTITKNHLASISKSPLISKSRRQQKKGGFASFGASASSRDSDLLFDTEKFAEKSLNLFSRNNKFRLFLFRCVQSINFDLLILSLIFINSGLLSVSLSFNLRNNSEFDFFDFGDFFFLFIYSIEAFMKISAWGLYTGKESYLRNSWNILDFSVVSISFICLIPVFKNLETFKLFRMLRPLRTISFFPGLRKLITMLAESIKQMLSLFYLMLFFFLLFGVFGTTIWAGLLTYRCRADKQPSGGLWPPLENSKQICGGSYACPVNHTCASITEYHDKDIYFFNPALDFYAEQNIPELNFGFTNFDNILKAVLTIFQAMTLEGWSSVMYLVQNGYNYYSAAAFFVFIAVVMNYFVLNFTIAIMMNTCRNLTFNTDVVEDEGAIGKKLASDAAHRLKIKLNFCFLFVKKFIKFVKGIKFFRKFDIMDCDFDYNRKENHQKFNFSKATIIKDDENIDNIINPKDEATNKNNNKFFERQFSSNNNKDYKNKEVNDENSNFKNENYKDNKFKENGNLGYSKIAKKNNKKNGLENGQENSKVKTNIITYSNELNQKNLNSQIKSEEIKSAKFAFHKKSKLFFYCFVISKQPIFQYLIYVMVITNVIVLALNDVVASAEAIKIYDYINNVLIIILSLELILKLLGLGFFNFIKKITNVFDFLITALSIYEFSNTKKSSFGILRIVRLYRLLKLTKNWKTLSIIIKCIKYTTKEILYYLILISIMIYVYALIGMTLFKDKLKFNLKNEFDPIKGISPYLNFDDIYIAFISVFTLLIGDDWQLLMYDCLRSPLTQKVAVYIYFISVIILLNIVMMNLVIAFLVFNFESARKRFLYEEQMNKWLLDCQTKDNHRRSNSFSFFGLDKLQFRKALLQDKDLIQCVEELGKKKRRFSSDDFNLDLNSFNNKNNFYLNKFNFEKEKKIDKENYNKENNAKQCFELNDSNKFKKLKDILKLKNPLQNPFNYYNNSKSFVVQVNVNEDYKNNGVKNNNSFGYLESPNEKMFFDKFKKKDLMKIVEKKRKTISIINNQNISEKIYNKIFSDCKIDQIDLAELSVINTSGNYSKSKNNQQKASESNSEKRSIINNKEPTNNKKIKYNNSIDKNFNKKVKKFRTRDEDSINNILFNNLSRKNVKDYYRKLSSKASLLRTNTENTEKTNHTSNFLKIENANAQYKPNILSKDKASDSDCRIRIDDEFKRYYSCEDLICSSNPNNKMDYHNLKETDLIVENKVTFFSPILKSKIKLYLDDDYKEFIEKDNKYSPIVLTRKIIKNKTNSGCLYKSPNTYSSKNINLFMKILNYYKYSNNYIFSKNQKEEIDSKNHCDEIKFLKKEFIIKSEKNSRLINQKEKSFEIIKECKENIFCKSNVSEAFNVKDSAITDKINNEIIVKNYFKPLKLKNEEINCTKSKADNLIEEDFTYENNELTEKTIIMKSDSSFISNSKKHFLNKNECYSKLQLLNKPPLHNNSKSIKIAQNKTNDFSKDQINFENNYAKNNKAIFSSSNNSKVLTNNYVLSSKIIKNDFSSEIYSKNIIENKDMKNNNIVINTDNPNKNNYFSASNLIEKTNKTNPVCKLIKARLKKFLIEFFNYISESSLFIFHQKMRIRRLLIIIINKLWFEYLTIIIIFLSCILLLLESPYNDPNSNYTYGIKLADQIFTFIFFFEMIAKMIAYGLFFNKMNKIQNIFEEFGTSKDNDLSEDEHENDDEDNLYNKGQLQKNLTSKKRSLSKIAKLGNSIRSFRKTIFKDASIKNGFINSNPSIQKNISSSIGNNYIDKSLIKKKSNINQLSNNDDVDLKEKDFLNKNRLKQLKNTALGESQSCDKTSKTQNNYDEKNNNENEYKITINQISQENNSIENNIILKKNRSKLDKNRESSDVVVNSKQDKKSKIKVESNKPSKSYNYNSDHINSNSEKITNEKLSNKPESDKINEKKINDILFNVKHFQEVEQENVLERNDSKIKECTNSKFLSVISGPNNNKDNNKLQEHTNIFLSGLLKKTTSNFSNSNKNANVNNINVKKSTLETTTLNSNNDINKLNQNVSKANSKSNRINLISSNSKCNNRSTWNTVNTKQIDQQQQQKIKQLNFRNVLFGSKTKQQDEQLEKLMQKAYLRDIFNIIDFTVIIGSIIYFFDFDDSQANNTSNLNLEQQSITNSQTKSLSITSTLYTSLRALRALRALRPLRMISKLEELKIVVYCLVMSTGAIFYMFLIGFFMLFIYSLVGMNLFSGTVGFCSCKSLENRLDCVEQGCAWTAYAVNFDTIGSSMLTLFQMATASNWVETMKLTIIGNDNNRFISLYFLSFMIVGCIFIMNLAVTVIVDNFSLLNKHAEGIALLTEDQQNWVKAMKYFLKYKPIPHFDLAKMPSIRKNLYLIVNKKSFNFLINFLILINVLLLFTQTDRSSQALEDIQSYFFYFSIFCFNLEMLFRLYAYRKFYFIDNWNKFDLIVVIISNASIFLTLIKNFFFDITELDRFQIIPVLIRGIRILRVLRLINLNESLKGYFYTFVILIPSLVNIGSLILIILTIYAVIGMNYFSLVTPGNVINSNNNFQSFFSSLLTLIRVTFGDNWSDIMNELAETKADCRDTQSWADLMAEGPKGCGGNISYWYFLSFVMLNNMVVFNLFIAVVVESFMTHTEKLDEVVQDNVIVKFYQLWGKYDKNIEYRLAPWEFVILMLELGEPLGIKKEIFHEPGKTQNYYSGNIYFSDDFMHYADDKMCIKALKYLNIEARGGFIHIIDAIKLVCKRAIDNVNNSENNNEIKEVVSGNNIGNEKAKNNKNGMKIKHKFFVKKLNQKFFSYNKQYKRLLTKKQTENSAIVVAKDVIRKFMQNWREKQKAKIKKKNSSGKNSHKNQTNNQKEISNAISVNSKIKNSHFYLTTDNTNNKIYSSSTINN